MDDGRLLHGHNLVLEIEEPSPQTAHYPKFHNDGGVAEIRIGVREFNCIGMSPPHDHPHVYLNMGAQDVVLCPYCATRFRFDPQLRLLETDPLHSLLASADSEQTLEAGRSTRLV